MMEKMWNLFYIKLEDFWNSSQKVFLNKLKGNFYII